jgi:hypothetical protein
MIDEQSRGTGSFSTSPGASEVVMPRASADVRRKPVEFDEETWRAVDLLARDSMKSFQEIAAEAFRDLLRKYGRPSDWKAALKQSARSSAPPRSHSPNSRRARRKSASRYKPASR